MKSAFDPGSVVNKSARSTSFSFKKSAVKLPPVNKAVIEPRTDSVPMKMAAT